MKQRITYLLPQGTGLSASDIEVENESLKFTKASPAVEEWKFTLGMGELPEEVCTFPAYAFDSKLPLSLSCPPRSPTLTRFAAENVAGFYPRTPHPMDLTAQRPLRTATGLPFAGWFARLLHAEGCCIAGRRGRSYV